MLDYLFHQGTVLKQFSRNLVTKELWLKPPTLIMVIDIVLACLFRPDAPF